MCTYILMLLSRCFGPRPCDVIHHDMVLCRVMLRDERQCRQGDGPPLPPDRIEDPESIAHEVSLHLSRARTCYRVMHSYAAQVLMLPSMLSSSVVQCEEKSMRLPSWRRRGAGPGTLGYIAGGRPIPCVFSWISPDTPATSRFPLSRS
jgi:hypothetical protein